MGTLTVCLDSLTFYALCIKKMTQFLVAAIALSMGLPDAGSFKPIAWKPQFTDPSELRITESTVAILTHSSRAFDPLGATEQGVRQTVAIMKAAELPVLYLHDKNNFGNPAWMYLYDDWKPTAFVASDVGHIDVNLSQVEHVVCLGGYFGQCENATVRDVLREWHQDGICHDMRITQITNGVFTVGQHVRYDDPSGKQIHEFYRDELLANNPRASMSVDQVLSRICAPNDITEYLKRQLPGVPQDVNVVMDVFGEMTTLQIVSDDSPTLTFAYRKSDQFLNYESPVIDFDEPAKSWRPWAVPLPTFESYPVVSQPLPLYSEPIISQPVYSSTETIISDGGSMPGVPIYGAPLSGGSIISAPFAPTVLPPTTSPLYLDSGQTLSNQWFPIESFPASPSYIIP